jgi:transcriptional regulator GlxA family with amidase domain
VSTRVVIPVFDGVQPLDVVGPYEVFAGAARLAPPGGGYEVRLVGAGGAPVVADSGLRLLPDGPLPPPGEVDLLLVPGGGGARSAATADAALVGWVREAAAAAPRVASVCTGAFLLAAAGVLDGRPASTHWAYAAELADRFPAVDVQLDPIYLVDGRVWTSAGVTAGMDLALAMVEHDLGAEIAQTVARWLVLYLRRPGGQSQFATPVWSPPAPQPAVRAAQDLIHTSPESDLRVSLLAARAGMSVRHFSREFARLVGTPPGQYVERVRVEAARRLLDTEPVTVGVAARRCGFGTAETMRQAFVRRLGIPPDEYRKRFVLTGRHTEE